MCRTALPPSLSSHFQRNNYGLASTRTFTRSFPLPWRAMPQHADATETETRQTKNSKHTRLSSGAPKCTERGFLWCLQHILWAPMMSPALFSVPGTEEKLPLPWWKWRPSNRRHRVSLPRAWVLQALNRPQAKPCPYCTWTHCFLAITPDAMKCINYYKQDELRYMGDNHRS